MLSWPLGASAQQLSCNLGGKSTQTPAEADYDEYAPKQCTMAPRSKCTVALLVTNCGLFVEALQRINHGLF